MAYTFYLVQSKRYDTEFRFLDQKTLSQELDDIENCIIEPVTVSCEKDAKEWMQAYSEYIRVEFTPTATIYERIEKTPVLMRLANKMQELQRAG